MELPSVCGSRVAACTGVYLQDRAPSGYSIHLQFDNCTPQAHVLQALLSFQVFCNLGRGVCGSALFVQICVRVKQINEQTKKQEQSPPFKTLTLTSPTFCGVSRSQKNSISSPDVWISSSRSRHIGIPTPLIREEANYTQRWNLSSLL